MKKTMAVMAASLTLLACMGGALPYMPSAVTEVHAVSSKVTIDGFEYEIYHKGTALGNGHAELLNWEGKITDKNAVTEEDMKDITVPDTVEGEPVTVIAADVFKKAANIRKLTLPDSIREFEEEMFWGSNITEINIPEMTIIIPDRCFYKCQKLEKVVFHDDVVAVSQNAFKESSFVLPEKYVDERLTVDVQTNRFTKTVGDWVLSIRIVDYEFDASIIKYMGTDSVLTIPAEIGGYEIKSNSSEPIIIDNKNVRKVVFDDNVLCIPNLSSEYLESVEIPDRAGNLLFLMNCNGLKELTLPERFTSLINQSDFDRLIIQGDKFDSKGRNYGFSSAKYLELPGNCTITGNPFYGKIGTLAFRSGDSIDINKLNALSFWGYYDGLVENSVEIKNIIFPDDIKNISIGNHTFDSSKIQGVEFSESADDAIANVTIGKNAFSNSQDLENVEFGRGLTKIDMNAFRNCGGIKEITINGDAKIGNYAFESCTGLKKLELSGKAEVGELAFNGCTELSEVSFDLSNDISGRCFSNCHKLYTINGIEVVKDGSAEFAPELKDYIMKNWQTVDEVGFIDKFTVNSAKKVVSEVVDDSMTDIQKVKALHDWVCANTVYGNDKEQYLGDHVDSSVFMDGVAVCEGYAKTYNLLLHESGIDTCFVHNGDHAWNVVKINGEWFHIDTTWDDGENVNYNWFMRSDADMKNAGGSHATWTLFCPSELHSFQSSELPACDTEMGDANGDSTIDAKDASTVLAEYSNLSVGNEQTFSNKQTASADINFDGNTDAKDASSILAYYSYLSTGGDKSIMEYILNNM